MALYSCPDCHAQISTTASQCPCCGAQFPGRGRPLTLASSATWQIIVAIVVSWAVCGIIGALILEALSAQ